MIGYRISLDELTAAIEDEEPGWLRKEADRTEEFRRKGRYEERKAIWSAIKRVYMTLQGGCKCAYCERKLESQEYGAGEQDVEHFRPKGQVQKWKAPDWLTGEGVAITEPPARNSGYYLLPYHPFNYSAACKPCNSALKKKHFPIAGTYKLDGDDPTALIGEQPLLIYPIGDFDAAPEDLIGFNGLSPCALKPGGYERARALVTIEFFKLDDFTKRKNLFRERATVISALYPQLQRLAGVADETSKREAEHVVSAFTGQQFPHVNCARSFKRLYDRDPAEAERIFMGAGEFLGSCS